MPSRPTLTSAQEGLLAALVSTARKGEGPAEFIFGDYGEWPPPIHSSVKGPDGKELSIHVYYDPMIMLNSLESSGLVTVVHVPRIGSRMPHPAPSPNTLLHFELCQSAFDYVDWLRKPRILRWIDTQFESTSKREFIIPVLVYIVLKLVEAVAASPWERLRSQLFHSPIP